MKTARQLTDLIGNTPLLELNRYAAGKGLEDACLLGKLECFNPLSSAKDRVALALIEDAERQGLIREGATQADGSTTALRRFFTEFIQCHPQNQVGPLYRRSMRRTVMRSRRRQMPRTEG